MVFPFFSGSSRLVGQEDKLLQMIYEKGPVAVAVDAQTWYNYQGGIIQHHCENHNNHAVQIVGYDISGTVNVLKFPTLLSFCPRMKC